MVQTYLAHHGIKGQRWGVRRFQNADGTRTEAGKRRYSDKELGKAKTIAENASRITDNLGKINRAIGDIHKESVKSKSLSDMTDQELRNRVNRMNLEQRYSELSAGKKSRGEVYVGHVLEMAGGALGVASSALAIALSIRQLKSK